MRNRKGEREGVLSRKTPPRRVRYLLLDQGREIELRIKLVGFCPGVRKETLLVEFFCYLRVNGFR